MKIAWFTPFSDKSAIGIFSRAIAEELQSVCDVHVWAPNDGNLLPTNMKIFPFDARDDLAEKLREYDFTIYNMGDHHGFHKDVYEISKRHRGVVILHDYMMHHFFYAYYLIHNKQPDAYIRDMRLYYGDTGKSIACDMIQGKPIPEWETEIMRYPFFEKAIEGARGVFCHSFFIADLVSDKILPPVGMCRLPGYHDSSINGMELDRQAWGIPKDRILLVTVGHVNPNKRIDRVIEFIGKQGNLRDKVAYAIIGVYDHNPLFKNYMDLIEKYDLRDIVKFLGYQPDAVLHEFMASADIFVNLRCPVMEGGSASLVEQMLYGKPIMVSDSGHYAELPDDCVVKIRTDHEEEDFIEALEMLVNSYAARTAVGARGSKFAADECTAPRYCRAFVDYLHELRKWTPLLDLTDRAARELYAMGASREVSAVDEVAKEICAIFQKEND